MLYTTKGKVWVYSADTGGSWHFIHVDKTTSDAIKEKTKAKRKGFGSVKINATIGKTSWETSLFPSARDGVYLLPLKADIRKKENIFEGDAVEIRIALQ